jgi:hypothetical protein
MNIHSLSTFSFPELSPIAKENAIEKIRYSNSFLNYEWYDYIVEDFKSENELFEIDKVYFSGFCSQGDGAMFTYTNIHEKLIDKYLETTSLPNWKKELIKFARIVANGKHKGHYYHEFCAEHNIQFIKNNLYNSYPNIAEFLDNIFPDIEDFIIDTYQDICRTLYRNLEKEYDYLNSDERITEYAIINKIEFTESGNIFNSECFT